MYYFKLSHSRRPKTYTSSAVYKSCKSALRAGAEMLFYYCYGMQAEYNQLSVCKKQGDHSKRVYFLSASKLLNYDYVNG